MTDGNLSDSAAVLASRFGLRRGNAAGTAAAAAGGESYIDLDTPAVARPTRALAFPLTVAGLVLAVAGTLVWLSLAAPDTLARMEAAARQGPVLRTPVLAVDGTPRFPDAAPGASSAADADPAGPAATGTPETPAPEPAVDPVDLPVTLGPSRNPDLQERTRAGLLPRIGEDGVAPWQFYARPFPQEDTRPRIAIVLFDLGLSRTMLESAIDRLPGAVTFAFPAGLTGVQEMIDRSRTNGHEVLLSVPMEPEGYPRNDPGPGTLLTRLTDQDNLGRLEKALAAASGYVGLTSPSGTRFTAEGDHLRAVLQQLKRRGLVFVDAWMTPRSTATRLSTELGLPRATSDLLVDRVASAGGIDAQLQELERLARANGAAVGFAQPFPATLERLAAWAAGLKDRGIVLAPVTAVLNRQADR
ncbi:divergent polysaccharide deacetylase family protein [Rhodospirillum centenum]|uniref:divergent polysaccharide deacetylase family protein n=1 Tax=Rhodospirillum centenum TaxID=34018 RepID=UPI0011D0DB6D|nr:divergent polysaccharide deacetylase family protein [Rhodospirillum centenum]